MSLSIPNDISLEAQQYQPNTKVAKPGIRQLTFFLRILLIGTTWPLGACSSGNFLDNIIEEYGLFRGSMSWHCHVADVISIHCTVPSSVYKIKTRGNRPFCNRSFATSFNHVCRSKNLARLWFWGHSSSGWEAHEDLEVILAKCQQKTLNGKNNTHVNHPLETSQCSDHDNSDGETIPETHKSDVLVDTSHSSSECLTRCTIGVEF
jgi:hypothetical protein